MMAVNNLIILQFLFDISFQLTLNSVTALALPSSTFLYNGALFINKLRGKVSSGLPGNCVK